MKSLLSIASGTFFILSGFTYATTPAHHATETHSTEHGAAATASSPAEDGAYEQRALTSISESLHRVSSLLEQRSIRIKSKLWTWTELDTFQRNFWKTMALDPARLDAKFIPPHLDPVYLTGELEHSLESLKSSRHIAERYGVTEAFDEYVALCEEMIQLRHNNYYRLARLYAKKGLLEGLYTRLSMDMSHKAESQMEISVLWDRVDRQELLKELTFLRSEFQALNHHYGELRQPASLPTSRLESMKKLLWVLFPLVFLTGFVGGLTWKSSEHGSELSQNKPSGWES